ncbi:DUF488 domain-containing protein [Rhizobium leucaenae]|uniref:Uncharacterized protein YeaO (DUF488 family) n=1 Tax=Rhizobium leucaenae TaxID=29450 RepID=A0A7W6ZZQ2_9HYPH|nr:DUF488 family protein [Rhizobium leucaenae]MBB4571579.1 uncharacterized protein YeaO (DUF488 family) [Rhizobium leucaenae]MBB6303835.1 uncharacterized protein YeaO (DUF488 family) [Rhizobium leucaenae]
MAHSLLKLKRVYDKPSHEDGRRVLVDRLWPRGLSKKDAKLTDWIKDVAPSPQLRTWFGHKPERFADFRAKYRQELASNSAVQVLLDFDDGPVTLVYGAKDPVHNHAVVLLEFLNSLQNRS